MIKENQKLLNRIQVVLDAGVIIVAYVLSWYIRFRSGLFDLDPWYLSLREYMKVLFFLVPSYLILYYAFQLYTPKRVQGRRLEAWHVVQANVIGLMGVTMVFFLTAAKRHDAGCTCERNPHSDHVQKCRTCSGHWIVSGCYDCNFKTDRMCFTIDC